MAGKTSTAGHDVTELAGSAPGALRLLGLGDLEASVYRWLIDHPFSDSLSIACGVGASRRQIDEQLTNLNEKGLVNRSASERAVYAPAAPDAALNALLLKVRQQLELARAESAQLADRFRLALQRTGAAVELVEVVNGTPALIQRGIQVRMAATRELLSFSKPPLLRDVAAETSRSLEGLERGLSVRAIYDPEAVAVPGAMEHIRATMHAGERARVASVPIKLLIADAAVAHLPITSPDGTVDRSLIVRSQPVVEALVVLFERYWERAAPLNVPETGGTMRTTRRALSASDREVLALLAAGQKDQAIARALGVTHRTVGRRILHLMTLAGARTRFQLGDEARRRGWLDEPGRPRDAHQHLQ